MLYVSKIMDFLKFSLDKNAFMCYNMLVKGIKQKEERKKNENPEEKIYPYRTPCGNCDYRNPGRYAAACAEQGTGKSFGNIMCWKFETGRTDVYSLWRFI